MKLNNHLFNEYLKIGWRIYAWATVFSIIIQIAFFLLINGISKSSLAVFFPMSGLLGIPIMNKLIEKYGHIIEFVVLIVILKIGLIITHESLQYPEYRFHEAWLFFYCMYLVMSISTCFYWKRMVAVFWIVQIYNFIQLHLKYNNISCYMYTGWIFICVFFPCLSMVVAKILLGFILMLNNNHELIKSIKRILQVFPEGIIIQSFDENTQKLVVQFVNNTAVKEIVGYKNPLGKEIDDSRLDFKVEINKDFKELSSSSDLSRINRTVTLSEILNSQIEEADVKKSEVSNFIIMKNKDIDIQNEEEEEKRYYNVKTICAKWEDNANSFIHVFDNITSIKQVEMEKARNDCLHLMFSSISHEFRTPINAFSNSMLLIESNYHKFI